MQKNNLIVESLYRTVNTAAQKKKLTESTDIIKEYKIYNNNTNIYKC